jgi:DNA-binding NarL/FixJ family response regulator
MPVLVEAGDAGNALEQVRRLRRHRGVVGLVGLSLDGDRDSYWLIRSLREQYPSMPILALGSNAKESDVTRALFAGADGFVDKDAEPEAFLEAVRHTAKGEMVLTGIPDGWLGDPAVEPEVPPERRSTVLTRRELEVLTVAAEGLTARQIARRLGVRERTVTTHLSRIYRKLGAGSRVAAIYRAARLGLVAVGHRE